MEAARFVSPDLNVAWAESQQRKFLQNQAPPELKSQNWSGEFGNASQITSPGSAAQQNTPNQQECLYHLFLFFNLTNIGYSFPTNLYAA